MGEVGGEAEEGEERKEAGEEEEEDMEEEEEARMPTASLELVAIFLLTILHSYFSLHLHTYHTVVSAMVPFQIWQFMQALLVMDLPFSVLVPKHGSN